MRVRSGAVGILGFGAFALSVGTGCSSSNAAGAGGGSTTATAGSTASATTGAGGASTTTTGGGGGAPCAPTAACTVKDKSCLGLVDNTGQAKFGLRMSELDITAPAVLAMADINAKISGAVTPTDPACNLVGAATFSWLLQFDTTAGTLKTGGAKPVPDATMGYSFDDEMIAEGMQMFHVQPITSNAKPDGSGAFSMATGQDLIVPIFLDAAATEVILFPLKQMRFTMGTLSSNENCIGQYNAAGLQPANNCLPDATHPQFMPAGALDSFISLEDADTVVISVLNESLCVLLAGSNPMFQRTPAGSSSAVCARDANNKILYQGDWCSGTNAAATPDCADAQRFTGNFAASSILINN